MYGSSVYNIRSEYSRSKSIFFRLILTVVVAVILLFALKQLIGIPLEYLRHVLGTAFEFGDKPTTNFAWKEMFLKNQMIQAVIVFFTGIVGVFTKFFHEIKEMLIQ